MPISLTTCLILADTLKNILHYFLWLAWAWPGTEAYVITGQCCWCSSTVITPLGDSISTRPTPRTSFLGAWGWKRLLAKGETLECSCKLVQSKEEVLFLDQPDTEKWYGRFVVYKDATSFIFKNGYVKNQVSKVQNVCVWIHSFHYHVHF